MKNLKATTLAAAISALAVAPTPALATVEVGVLECNVSGGSTMIIASESTLDCTLNRPGDAAPVAYTGTVSKFGLDVGVKGAEVIEWAVVTTEDDIEFAPETLEGDYIGATASAAVGIGGGANALVGGNADTISLQPVSIQGQTGVNLAVGVASMSLTRVE